jgi:hypothetical protein
VTLVTIVGGTLLELDFELNSSAAIVGRNRAQIGRLFADAVEIDNLPR